METPKERLMRQIEALKRRDFKEVARIGKLVKNELLKKKEEEVLKDRQEKLTGFK